MIGGVGRAAVLLLLALPLAAQNGPFAVAGNFETTILGTDDTRPETWGKAGAVTHTLRFLPPPGYRVRVLRVYGDFLIWPKGAVQPGRFAGALWALHTTGPDGSKRADLAADNHLLYVQTATGGDPARVPIDFDVSEAGLLPDGQLISKMAVWLNDTGLPIHMECSWVIVFRWEVTQAVASRAWRSDSN